MSLTDIAITRLKEMIVSGRFGPGDRLPVEKELASELGLSRNSLREAVRALSLVGILDTRQGDGTYVTSLDPGRLLGTTGLVMDLVQERNVVELLGVRRMLEPSATALAAARIDGYALSELGVCLERMEGAESIEELVEADDEFHGLIFDATGNATLAALARSLSGRTFRARLWRGMTDETAIERTRDGHRAIYEALVARDPELARSAATSHIAEVEGGLATTLSPDAKEAPEGADGPAQARAR